MEIESVLIKARKKTLTSKRIGLRAMLLVIYLLACLTMLELANHVRILFQMAVEEGKGSICLLLAAGRLCC